MRISIPRFVIIASMILALVWLWENPMPHP